MEKFFDNIKVFGVLQWLSKKIPFHTYLILQNYILSPCKLPEKEQLDESETRFRNKQISQISQDFLSKCRIDLTKFLFYNSSEKCHYLLTPLSRTMKNYEIPEIKSLPQGSPISPLLSGHLLSQIIPAENSSGVRSILYADDGLYYGKFSELPAIDDHLGLNVKYNLKKSG